MSKSLVKQQKNDVGEVINYDEFSSMETIDAEDMVISTIFPLAANSTLMADKKLGLKAGSLVDSATKSCLAEEDEPFFFIPLSVSKYYLLYQVDNKNMPLTETRFKVHSKTDEYKEIDSWKKQAARDEMYTLDGQEYIVKLCREVLVLPIIHGELIPFPSKINFKGMSTGAGKNLLTEISRRNLMLRRPFFACIFALTSKQVPNPFASGLVCQMEVSFSENLDIDQLKVVQDVYNMFIASAKGKVIETVDLQDEEPVEVKRKPEQKAAKAATNTAAKPDKNEKPIEAEYNEANPPPVGELVAPTVKPTKNGISFGKAAAKISAVDLDLDDIPV